MKKYMRNLPPCQAWDYIPAAGKTSQGSDYIVKPSATEKAVQTSKTKSKMEEPGPGTPEIAPSGTIRSRQKWLAQL